MKIVISTRLLELETSTTHEENSGACFRQRFLHSGNLRRDPCARQGILYRGLVSLGAVGASAPMILQVVDVSAPTFSFHHVLSERK